MQCLAGNQTQKCKVNFTCNYMDPLEIKSMIEYEDEEM